MPINVAVLGIGNHAQRNTLPALAECESLKLIGISSRNKAIAAKEARRYGCQVYQDGDEILADKNVDVLYVALPTGLHAEWGMKTIQSGKHLWCEKSLTHDPLLTQQLVNEARHRDLCVCECFMYTHHPQFNRLKQIMQGKQIGEIKCIIARFGFPHLAADNIRYEKVSGGGALLDAGCYPLHAVRQLANSMPKYLHSIVSKEEKYDVDTRGSALLGFDSGLQAHLEWGFGLSYVNEIELWAEKGQAIAVMAFSKSEKRLPCLKIIHPDGMIETEDIPHKNHFISMFDSFSNACSDIILRQLYWDDAIQQSILMEQLAH